MTESHTPFTVIMSVYRNDRAQWLSRAVESLRTQTVLPAEIILVVDGPIPEELNGTVTALESDPLFRVIRLAENKGLGNARNLGVTNAAHELIACMDADDIAKPYRFERQLACFEADPELAIVGGHISEFIGEEENITGYRVVPSTHEEICAYLKERCPFNHPSVMFKKSAVQQAGGYLDWFWNEDYYLWLRMYLAGLKMANVPEVLVHMRAGKDMYNRRGGKKYYESEKRLQRYMLEQGIIGKGTYRKNVLKRFILQRMLPASVRGFLFKKLARAKKVN